jgi:thiol-disulfide isomerase/thioredoxin
MIKLLNTVLLAFLLSACSTPEESEKKEVKTPVEKIQEKSEPTQATSTQNLEPSKIKASEAKTALQKSMFTIQTIDGKEIHVDEAEGGLTFQEFKDKAVFVIFFGYRCPPCLAEIPALIKLTKQKHPDLEIIALEVQGLNSEKLKFFQDRKEINYNLAVQKNEGNSKFLGYIATKAQWGGSIPFLISFNPKGEVKMVHVGGLRYEQLEMIYKNTIDKK